MTEQSGLDNGAWSAFEAGLRAYVRRRVDPASADDVAGDVLLRLVRHQDALAAAKNPSAWVRRVAANTLADHHRRRAAEQRAVDALKSAAEPEANPPDSANQAAAEVAGCLVPFVRNLPEPYREALLLTDIGGLTQMAAADRLGLSVSGMKSRVQRGRAKLKEALLRCCTIEVDRRGGVVDYQRRAKRCDTAC